MRLSIFFYLSSRPTQRGVCGCRRAEGSTRSDCPKRRTKKSLRVDPLLPLKDASSAWDDNDKSSLHGHSNFLARKSRPLQPRERLAGVCRKLFSRNLHRIALECGSERMPAE